MKFGRLVLYKKNCRRTKLNFVQIGLLTITLHFRTFLVDLGGIPGRRFLHHVVEQFFRENRCSDSRTLRNGVNKTLSVFFFRPIWVQFGTGHIYWVTASCVKICTVTALLYCCGVCDFLLVLVLTTTLIILFCRRPALFQSWCKRQKAATQTPLCWDGTIENITQMRNVLFNDPVSCSVHAV